MKLWKFRVNFSTVILLLGSLLGSGMSFADDANMNTANSSISSENTSIITPEIALQRLIEGNKRFSEDRTTCPERNQMRRLATAAKQRPFAVILGCSDSRIPPEITFDQGIGDVFVVRVAGNIVSAVELDSIEYSAIYNKSSIIMVLGHENCGAIQAVLNNQTKDIESVANLIKPSLAKLMRDHKEKNGEERNKSIQLVKAIEANVLYSVQKIKQSPPIAKLMKENKINVVGAYYDFETGKVRLLDATTSLK